DPEGSRKGFGALLLGVYEPDGKLRYSGKVGTGFNDATLNEMYRRLRVLEVKEPAFSNPPRGYEAKGAHWIKPELVAEIEFTEWTNDGTLRHPSFQGLREDKNPRDVVRERAAADAEEARAETPAKAKASKKAASNTAAKHTAAKQTDAAAPAKRSARKSVKPAEAEDAPAASNSVAGIKLSNPDKVLYPEAGLTKHDLARFYETIGDWILPHLANRPLT